MLVAAVFLTPLLAFAQEKSPIDTCGWDFFCYGSMLFNWASLVVGQLIGMVAGFLISIAASLIGVLINLGPEITSSPIVREGFKLTLSITNLGFVIAIIVIAFGTMLRLQSYGVKQMIGKLVIAALLVNFSFTFAGIVIDFFNVFGNFFIQAASPEDINKFAANLAQSLNVSSLSGVKVSVPDNFGGDVLKFGLSYVSSFVSVASTAMFMTALVITFFAIAFMLVVRYLWLIFLLIVMPLAWLAWIFPGLSQHSKEWWNNFLKWNIFFPAISFFLYLSILTSDKLGGALKSQSVPEALAAAKTISGLSEGVLIGFLQIIVQVGMMFGGLIVAQELGAVGSNTAMSMANSAKGWILGATGKTIRGATGITAARAGGTAVGANLRTRLINSDTFRGAAGILSRVPGLRNISAGMYDAAETVKSNVAARQKEIMDQHKSKEALLAASKSYKYSDEEKAAWAAALAEKGVVDKVDPGMMDDLLNSARKLGTGQSIAAKDPTLAPKIYKEEDVIKKNPELASISDPEERKKKIGEAAVEMAMASFRPADAEKLSADKVEQLAHLFQKSHRERVAKEGDVKTLLALAKAAEKLLAEGRTDHPLVEFAANNPAMQQVLLNAAFSKELKNLAEVIKARKEEEAKKKAAKKAREESQQEGGPRIETVETKKKSGPGVGF